VQTISFAALIEEAVADHSAKHLSGQVTSFDRLLQEDNLIALEQSSPTVFAFLAFHPTADAAIADYVKQGTLGSDSGTKVLVLFTLDAAAHTIGRPLTADGVQIDTGVHPAYEMVRILFAPKPPPPLPGVIFVSRFSGDGPAVYVHLNEATDVAAVRGLLRNVFALAESSYGQDENRERFAGSFAAALQQAQIPHSQSGRTSIREWLVRAVQFAAKHQSDLIAVISAVLP
jgi:hypothetical protein